MALVNMKDILHGAGRGGYGVGAFNLLNMEAVKGALRAAEELCSPLIMQLAEVQLPGSPMNFMVPMMVHAAREAGIPVAVHYDHGLTLPNILRALKYGCTSVMFDGAALPFEENVRRTKEIADMAHALGADCEAELGVVGGAEAGGNADAEELLTDVSQAAEFVERTGCDFLAVAIGNAHGPYVKKPNLRFERLRQLNEAVDVPLVLHGGSGISDADFRRCIGLGIRKINVATSLQQSVTVRMEGLCRTCRVGGVTAANSTTAPGELNYSLIAAQLETGVYDEAARHMRVFMSADRAAGATAAGGAVRVDEDLVTRIVHAVRRGMADSGGV